MFNLVDRFVVYDTWGYNKVVLSSVDQVVDLGFVMSGWLWLAVF